MLVRGEHGVDAVGEGGGEEVGLMLRGKERKEGERGGEVRLRGEGEI